MVFRFFVTPASKRWFLKIIHVTMEHDPFYAMQESMQTLHPSYPSSVVGSELKTGSAFPPMRVLEVKWSRARSLVCEVALNTTKEEMDGLLYSNGNLTSLNSFIHSLYIHSTLLFHLGFLPSAYFSPCSHCTEHHLHRSLLDKPWAQSFLLQDSSARCHDG